VVYPAGMWAISRKFWRFLGVVEGGCFGLTSEMLLAGRARGVLLRLSFDTAIGYRTTAAAAEPISRRL
jgi:hypothetical protein